MSYKKQRSVRNFAATALCGALCGLLAPTGLAHAVPLAPVEQSDKDVQAQFLALVAKFDKAVGRAKKQAYSSDAQLKKLKQRVEAAGWRVTAARERFDKTQSELASTNDSGKINKLKQRLAADRRLLEIDAGKLTELLNDSQGSQTTSTEILEGLRPLRDDVAIEADRFTPSEPGQKKAVRLLADAAWAIERLETLVEEFKTEFDAPANEVLERANVQ